MLLYKYRLICTANSICVCPEMFYYLKTFWRNVLRKREQKIYYRH